ncbi:MAG TPA: DUF6461 domain-containing protein [Micromonosporaceae bacterium]
MHGLRGYEWVDTLEAYCFTAIVGIGIDDAIRRLGGDPAHATRPRTFDECFWPADGPQLAQVGAVDGGLLVAEHNGWRAEEVVGPLSQGARIACFFRNVQAVMRFVYAVDGRIVCEFDPLLDPGPRNSIARHSLADALQGLPFGLFGAESSALTLVERLTSVRVAPSWLDTPQRCVVLPPLPADC